METWFLVKLFAKAIVFAGILNASLFGAAQSLATERQDLRLYRVNKDGIADRFWFTRGKAKQAGCHNIRKKSRLHRAVQFGYPVCRVYTQKNCAPESIVSFTRDDGPGPTTELSQGYSWFSVSEHPRGRRIKSWYCGEALAKADANPVVSDE